MCSSAMRKAIIGSRSVFECESLSLVLDLCSYLESGNSFSPEDVALFKRKEKTNMSFTMSGKFLWSKSEKIKVLHLRSGQLRNVNELGILASLLNCTYIFNRPKGLLS